MRVSGVELKSKKRVLIALRDIYGIGATRALEICQKANIPLAKRVKDLTDEEGSTISHIIEEGYVVENELKRELTDAFRARLQIKQIKAWRVWNGLPANGQRTHTNGNTASKLRAGGK